VWGCVGDGGVGVPITNVAAFSSTSSILLLLACRAWVWVCHGNDVIEGGDNDTNVCVLDVDDGGAGTAGAGVALRATGVSGMDWWSCHGNRNDDNGGDGGVWGVVGITAMSNGWVLIFIHDDDTGDDATAAATAIGTGIVGAATAAGALAVVVVIANDDDGDDVISIGVSWLRNVNVGVETGGNDWVSCNRFISCGMVNVLV
jgi:hypothetical protein